MKQGILTPFGEIQIYIDIIRSDYEYEPFCKDIRPLQERPLAGSYQIVIPKRDWQTIGCVVDLCDPGISNDRATGERYLYSEFVKDNIVLEWYGDGDPSASDYHAAIWIPVKKK